jgi:protein-tyrosine phosphatase
VRYAAGAGAAAAICLYVGGWALWLLWISVALLIVALIYGALDERAFQKAADGSLSAAVRWLLAPYLAAAWLNSRWWTRSCAAADPVLPGLWIGRLPTRAERDALGVRAIVDMAAELPCDSRGIHYASVPQLDLIRPTASQVQLAVQAIEAALVKGPVLVCCALGFSRSAAAVAAWLVASGRARHLAEAHQQVRRARPAVVIGDR